MPAGSILFTDYASSSRRFSFIHGKTIRAKERDVNTIKTLKTSGATINIRAIAG